MAKQDGGTQLEVIGGIALKFLRDSYKNPNQPIDGDFMDAVVDLEVKISRQFPSYNPRKGRFSGLEAEGNRR